jgi:predicted nucleotidyltransferase
LVAWNIDHPGMTLSVFRHREALAAICRCYDIRCLSLFGSTLKGSDRPDSDVDLLVDFQPGAKPSLLTMARIEIAGHRCWTGAKLICARLKI